jgi:hypothetical protein
MRAAWRGANDDDVRRSLTRERLRTLMEELARSAAGRRAYRVFLVGGGTAVLAGWRDSTVDVDLCADDDRVFRDIQRIKERLKLNVEFARPEEFVPPLAGSSDRHVFIETHGNVSYFHYDPYAQLLSKLVRGFQRDVEDADGFLRSGMVDPARFRSLVRAIPDAAFAKYPTLSRRAVLEVVDEFLSRRA